VGALLVRMRECWMARLLLVWCGRRWEQPLMRWERVVRDREWREKERDRGGVCVKESELEMGED